MKRQLKILLTVVYTAIFLVLAGTGALQTQASEDSQICEQFL